MEGWVKRLAMGAMGLGLVVEAGARADGHGLDRNASFSPWQARRQSPAPGNQPPTSRGAINGNGESAPWQEPLQPLPDAGPYWMCLLLHKTVLPPSRGSLFMACRVPMGTVAAKRLLSRSFRGELQRFLILVWSGRITLPEPAR